MSQLIFVLPFILSSQYHQITNKLDERFLRAREKEKHFNWKITARQILFCDLHGVSKSSKLALCGNFESFSH